MKTRFLSVLIIGAVVPLGLALSQTKSDCPAKTSSAKAANCCVKGAKAEMTSNTTTSKTDPKADPACPAGSKQCTMKGAKMTDKGTAGDPAKCPMMTKASQSGCCKNAMKTSEAKNTLKKSTKSQKPLKTQTETKGTN